MGPQELNKLIKRLKAACVQPKDERPEETALAWELILECCIVERLTDAELEHGYRIRVRKTPCFRPRYGDWLEDCRPAASSAVVGSEANRLFDLIRDNPGQVYGKYSPETGVIRDRRLIERAHGPAAGLAFVASGGSAAFATMTEKSETWIRKAFTEAYEAARADHGAPLTLDPARLLSSRPAPTPLLPGASSEEGEQQRKFRELVRGFREPGPGPRDVAARVAELRKQAVELGAGAAS